MGRATVGATSRKPGTSIVLVKTPLSSNPALPKRASGQVPMKWAQLTIIEACKKTLRTDQKTATCPTAMRVCTLARIEMEEIAAKGVLTKVRGSETGTSAPSAAAWHRTGWSGGTRTAGGWLGCSAN